MLFDTEKRGYLEGDDNNWKYSLARIHSCMDGVASVCVDAVSSFECYEHECEGNEPSPWDDVIKTINELNQFIEKAYPGI